MNSKGKKIILLILVVVLATFLRLYNLPLTPPGLYPDEAMNGNNGLEAIKTGDYKTFYPENNGREGLFINIQAFFLKNLIPQNGNPEPWMLRLPSALFGILTVIGVYFLTKELFSKNPNSEFRIPKQIQNTNVLNQKHFRISNFEFRISHGEKIALLASFLLAVSFWHINFSRIGFRAIMAPAFLTWGIYFLLLTFRKIKNSLPTTHYSLLTILAGLLYGLGFHSYIAYRATPILILIVFILFWLTSKTGAARRKIFLTAILFFFAAIIVIAPLALYFLNNPTDFFGRTTQVSVFSSQTPAKDLIFNIGKTAGMFNFSGDWNPRHNIAGRPLLFWPVGIIFLFGLFFSIRELFKNNARITSLILLSWLTIAALPVVISNESIPHALRAILMAPPVFIISAAGGIYLYNWFAKKMKKNAFFALCSLLFAILTIEAFYSYFYTWGQNPEVKNAFSQNYVEIGRTLNALPRELPKYVIVEGGGVLVRGLPMPTQTVMFITDTFLPEDQKQKNIFYILPSQKENLPANAITVKLN